MKSQLLALLRDRSFERKRVVLASGKESDFFIDCKQAALTAEGHALIGALMFEEVAKLDAVAVAGVELGGCPLASAVALVSFAKDDPLDAIYVRKAAKDHGSQRMIEGDTRLAKGARIALLEDVVTTGGSTIRAMQTLKDAGYAIAGVLALVDRLEGGREAIEKTGVSMTALFTRRDFIPD